MTPEESIRFRSCLFGTGLVLLPLLLGVAAALPYGVDGNGTSFTLNATGFDPWETVTGGSITLYPQQANGSWPRPNVTTANGTVLYSFANSTVTPPSQAPDLYWGGFTWNRSEGNQGGILGVGANDEYQLMVNWTWPCGMVNGSLKVERTGQAWVPQVVVYPLNKSVNWSAPTGLDLANNTSEVVAQGNLTVAEAVHLGPFNSTAYPFGVVVRTLAPPPNTTSVSASVTFNRTGLCVNTSVAIPNGTRLPLNLSTSQGGLSASGTLNTDGWLLNVTSDQGGSWNASSAGANSSGTFGTPQKVKAGSPAIWGVLANGSTCAGVSFVFAGNMSAVCLWDQATNASAPAYQQVQAYTVSSGGGGGGAAAPLAAPEPSPAAQTSSSSSSSSVPQTQTYSPSEPTTLTTESGVEAVVDPTYTEYVWEV